jgi:microsomal dipeptidase-like Zn-dependent dipeptidase
VGEKSAWDRICLGTDMDGVIEPLKPYTRYENLSILGAHLTQFFHRPFDLKEIGLNASEVEKLMYDYDPEELSEKVISKNVLSFLKKYFNNSYLGQSRPLA